jgi:hypothetical protein
MKAPKASAYAPYCSPANQRARRTLMAKFDPEIIAWSVTARPPFRTQESHRPPVLEYAMGTAA